MPSDGPGPTAALAGFAASAVFPPEVIARTRLMLLDHAACVIGARHAAPDAPSLLAAARALGLAAGGSGVFGDAARYTPAGAALLNGALARALDRDDVHRAASVHPGAVVIPAALAAAEMAGAPGRALLAGIAAGCEVAIRLSLALAAAAHRARGFHPTATCGAFGAAAAASRVFGLGADGVATAFGAAVGTAGGTLRFLSGGGWTGRFQVGWAAAGGLAAATLARDGFAAATEALEGEHGFLAAFAPAADPAPALAGLGEDFELMRTQARSGPDGAAGPYPDAEAGARRFAAAAGPALGAKRAAHLAEMLLDAERIVDVAALPRLSAPMMSAQLAGAGAAVRTWQTGRRRRS